MHRTLVMTLIGRDRPGLVEAVAAAVEAHGGNWEESRLARLAGQFAGLVQVHVPAARAGDLEQALGRLEGMSVVVAMASEEAALPDGVHLLELEVVGQDHPGIVRRLSETLAAQGINVDELETDVASAPMSGEPLFRARAKLRAPVVVTQEALEEDLESLADDLMVEIRLAEPG